MLDNDIIDKVRGMISKNVKIEMAQAFHASGSFRCDDYLHSSILYDALLDE
jgi:hypothetical protein